MSENDDLEIPKGFHALSPFDPAGQGTDARSFLGFGEKYSHGDARSKVRLKALELFLQAVDIVVPEVKQSLIDKVRPLYCQARSSSGSVHGIRDDGEIQQMNEEKPASPSETELHDGLLSWAEKYNLRTDVILEAARHTLSVWEVMEPLCKNVYPCYQPVAKKYGLLYVGEQSICPGVKELANLVEDPPPEWKVTIGKIVSWAEECGLDVQSGACFNAIVQLDRWFVSEDSNWTEWSVPQPVHNLYADKWFYFSTFGWRPESESWLLAEQRIRSSFEARLEEHRLQIQQEAEEGALIKTPQSMRRDKFECLARFQVRGDTYLDIAREYVDSGRYDDDNKPRGDEEKLESARKTVLNRVKSAAELVAGPTYNDWLRKSQRGPQKGNSKPIE